MRKIAGREARSGAGALLLLSYGAGPAAYLVWSPSLAVAGEAAFGLRFVGFILSLAGLALYLGFAALVPVVGLVALGQLLHCGREAGMASGNDDLAA